MRPVTSALVQALRALEGKPPLNSQQWPRVSCWALRGPGLHSQSMFPTSPGLKESPLFPLNVLVTLLKNSNLISALPRERNAGRLCLESSGDQRGWDLGPCGHSNLQHSPQPRPSPRPYCPIQQMRGRSGGGDLPGPRLWGWSGDLCCFQGRRARGGLRVRQSSGPGESCDS